jgi:uncharacterized protein (TIGR02246 family)
MQIDMSRQVDERQIRKLIDDWVKALREKDLNGMLSDYAPEVRSFDMLPPLENAGADEIRQRTKEWLASYQGPIECEVRDLHITAGEDVAFCHSLNRFSGTKKDGSSSNMWVRMTLGCRRVDGRWKVTHEHVSMPFDMQSGKALLELEP